METKEIERMLSLGEIKVERVEHHFNENQMVITYRRPSNQMLLSHPPQPVPDTLYRVVYGVEGYDLCILNAQQGTEKITPEFREVLYT